MPESKPFGIDQRRRRRWVFADCVFDEANWTLLVNEQRVTIETKPLELLRELLNHAGELVSKQDLLDRIWPDVTVVEASLTTAVHKLRLALDDDKRATHIIETVPKIGYRLSIPVKMHDSECAPKLSWAASGDLRPRNIAVRAAPGMRIGSPRVLSLSAGLAILVLLALISLGPAQNVSATKAQFQPTFSQRDAANALRALDVAGVEKLIAAGWNPNTPFDKEGNGAINYALQRCEWDRNHDQEKMLVLVRTLIEAGARVDRRNVWGDTPYSIAKAHRYCGPEHPVTKMLRMVCYEGTKPFGDRCLASYELAHQ